LTVRGGKLNLISTLLAICDSAFGPRGDPKALTLQNPPSIRAPMAAGAIPPPLFFERSQPREHIGSRHRSLKDVPFVTKSVDHVLERPARFICDQEPSDYRR
jgi:hypothetical protein